jgi:hypothetical protein|tara:strand:- start:4833 stop:5078 length:246 start_codon:yes stop_codon:yes gene_type:complete
MINLLNATYVDAIDYNEARETKRYLKLIAILFANGQELTKEGEEFALKSLEWRTPLEAAVDINFTQNNFNSSQGLLFVEVA